MFVKLSLLVLLFTLLISQNFVISTQVEIHETPTSQNCGLQCWLKHLKIDIPSQSFEKDTFNLTLKSLSCEQAKIGNLTTNTESLSLDVKVLDAGILCGGEWKIFDTIDPNIFGEGTVQVVVNESTIHAVLDLKKNTANLPYEAQLGECKPDIYVKEISFKGPFSKVLNDFTPEIEALIHYELTQVLCPLLEPLFTQNLTQLLQKFDELIEPYMLQPLPLPSPPVPKSGIVKLTQNEPILKLADYILNSVVGANGIMGLNIIFDKFTNSSGVFVLKNVNSLTGNFTENVPNLGNITFGLIDVNISGLNTWKIVELARPTNDYTLESSTLLEDLDINITFFVNVSTDGNLEDNDYLYEEGFLQGKLKNNLLNTTMVLAIKEGVFPDILESPNTERLLDPMCLLTAIYDFNITLLYLNFTVEELNLSTTTGAFEKQFDESITTILQFFTSSFSAGVPATFNAFVSENIRTLVNQQFNKYSKDAVCPERGTAVPFFGFESSVFAGVGATVLFLLFVILAHSQRLHYVDKTNPEFTKLIIQESPGLREENAKSVLKKMDQSLTLSRYLPAFIRYGVPFLLILNVFLFVSSNTSVGASVVIQLQIGAEKINLPPVFNFTLGNSVKDMWDAGVYPLSILIALFSGSWPYVKLALMLICWIMPVSKLPTAYRERIIMVLDALGKWSLVDAYVLVLMMVAFNLTLVDPHSPDASMVVFVQSDYGFYSFLGATMMSLVLTHIILASHRYIIKKASDELISENLSTDFKNISLLKRSYKKGTKAGKISSIALAPLLVFALALVFGGVSVDSFKFVFKGAVALVLEFTGKSSTANYSVFQVGEALPYSNENPDSFGVRWIQITFFLFAFAIPVIHLITILVLWVKPMSKKIQKRVFVITEILNAWSALEVFVVAIIAALLEIQQFAQFIIGSRCDEINKILKLYFNQAVDGDDKCFDVVAQLDIGCWILFSACIINAICSLSVMKSCHNAIHNPSLDKK